MDKTELRKSLKKERNSLPKEIKDEFDMKIFQEIINSKIYRDSKIIFIYVSYNSEVDTIPLIKYSLEIGKKVCVPKVLDKEGNMESLYIDSLNELKEGVFGILEPHSTNKANPIDIDLVITPGLAFDKKGGRIGYGKGYYDRYLTLSNKAFKLGVCYDFQIVSLLPTSKEDVKVDMIISEKNKFII